MISGQDDMADPLIAHDLKEAFDDLFCMLVVRVSHSPLVAGLRPTTDLDPVNLLAFQVLLCSGLTEPPNTKIRAVFASVSTAA